MLTMNDIHDLSDEEIQELKMMFARKLLKRFALTATTVVTIHLATKYLEKKFA